MSKAIAVFEWEDIDMVSQVVSFCDLRSILSLRLCSKVCLQACRPMVEAFSEHKRHALGIKEGDDDAKAAFLASVVPLYVHRGVFELQNMAPVIMRSTPECKMYVAYRRSGRLVGMGLNIGVSIVRDGRSVYITGKPYILRKKVDVIWRCAYCPRQHAGVFLSTVQSLNVHESDVVDLNIDMTRLQKN